MSSLEAPDAPAGELDGGGELLNDDQSWIPDDSEILDSGEGGEGGFGQLFENLKDVFGDS